MTRVTLRRLDVFVKKFYGNLAKYVGISYSESIIAMSGRISWLGVFIRLVGAIAVVLLTYNPAGYSFYHWAMRDFAAITAVKAFAGALLLVGWILAASAYLLTFWSLAGETPGMRFLSIEVEDYDGSRRLGFRRAWRRLGGVVLAAIPLGLGFLGILTRDDRRGWPDRRAGTDVIAVNPEIAPWATGKGTEAE